MTASTCRAACAAGPSAGAIICYRRRGHPGAHSAGAVRWRTDADTRAHSDRQSRGSHVRADLRARFQAIVARELARWADHLERLRTPPPAARRPAAPSPTSVASLWLPPFRQAKSRQKPNVRPW
jgi:hypothetical protein